MRKGEKRGVLIRTKNGKSTVVKAVQTRLPGGFESGQIEEKSRSNLK